MDKFIEPWLDHETICRVAANRCRKGTSGDHNDVATNTLESVTGCPVVHAKVRIVAKSAVTAAVIGHTKDVKGHVTIDQIRSYAQLSAPCRPSKTRQAIETCAAPGNKESPGGRPGIMEIGDRAQSNQPRPTLAQYHQGY